MAFWSVVSVVGIAAACSGGSSSKQTLPVEMPAVQPAVSTTPPAAEKKSPDMPKHPWPATKQVEVTDTVQGVKLADPYRWLEDEKSPEVQAWMKAQDEYARAELAKYPARGELAERMKKLLYYDAVFSPVHRKGRFFYTRKHADKEKAVVYWKQGEQGKEQVLFDPNTWSSDGSAGLGGWWPSLDGKYVAYSVKLNNSDETTTYVIDPKTGKKLKDEIAGTKYSGASWTPDGKGFYYTWVPPVAGKVTIAERPGFAEVRYHALGSDPAKDPIVHPATGNAETFLGGGISRDGHWLLAEIQHGWNSSDVFFKDARKPKAEWTTLVKGVDANFGVEVWRDKFYVKTNDGAPRYRVYKVDPKQPDRAAWKEIVPQSDATLDGMDVVGEHLILTYLRNAASEVEVHDLEGKLVRKIDVPALGTTSGMSGNPDEDTAYLSYTSFTEPGVIYKLSVKTGKTTEWTRIKLPIDTSNMVTEQVFYPSKDGTKVSMFIIHSKTAQKTGKNPTILYGYGGFNVNMTPSFSASRLVWIERGGVYAIPNLRGGGEYGEEWHRAGMLLKKQNVFDDFIAAGETLIKEGWTSSDHLGISGGSNGGLLVGAAVTQRPDLFKAVNCAVPLLDMLRFHLFGSGKTWVPEYGSAEDAAQFKALHAYSPYRVAVEAGPRKYPAVLFDSADHDDRVDPLHARKLAAVLQQNQTGTAPILLRIERNAGHGGADMVKLTVERVADSLGFFEAQLK
ncbi:MAG TPA: prolyl oligopeptidase family serine peptidase [Kofleriaceae bacterium]|nr:prolyl oligopeptidase family serine peptidase [Kofleriaceae bacterium]